jgi:hypothetical protein
MKGDLDALSSKPRPIIRLPIRYNFKDLVTYVFITSSEGLTTFQKVLHNQEKSKWMVLWRKKMESLHKNQT